MTRMGPKPFAAFCRAAQQLTRRYLRAGVVVTSLFLSGFAVVIMPTPAASAATSSQQHDWVGDIPIMPAFSIEPALGFAFDSPNGRIVMVFASSTAEMAEIMTFYNESLAAIGWQGGDGTWRRGPETLIISQVSTAAGPLWRLMLRPQ